MADQHLLNLSKLCRFCSVILTNRSFIVSEYKEQITRSVSNSSNSVWTRAEIINLTKQTPEDILPDKFFVKNDDPHLALCKCKIYDHTIRRPVLSACQHAFCLSCIIPKLEGKRQDDAECPVCHANILIDKSIPCTTMQDMTKMLQVECQKGCGQLYTILQKERLDHEASCAEADLSTQLNDE